MRSKVTVVLLFLNVILFFYIFQYEEKWRAERKSLEARRRVLGPEAASIDSITRTSRTGETVKLDKRPDGWWLSAPYAWPANPNAVAAIVSELQLLDHETSFPVDELAKSGRKLADYGLENPALVLSFTSAGTTKPFVLKIGDITEIGNRLYVLSPDGSRIHVVSRSLAENVGRPLADLRSNSLFSIPVFEVRSVNVQAAAPSNLKVRLRRDAASRWAFEAPINARASKTNVEVTVGALNGLVARSFLETRDADPARTGLENPDLRVTLEGNARRETLLLGKPTGVTVAREGATVPDPEYFAKIEDKTVIFTTVIPRPLLTVLGAAQEALRDPRVLDFEPATVTAVTLTAPGQPEVALQRLEPVAPKPGEPPATEAAKPGWQLVVRVSGQAPVTSAADPEVVAELLRKLSFLSAHEASPTSPRFLSDAPSAADLERWGFNRPEREVTLNLTGAGGTLGQANSALTLQVGLSPDKPGEAFARVTNAPTVYQILPDILEDAPAVARHYRLRLLRDLPETPEAKDNVKVTRLRLTELPAGTEVITVGNEDGLTPQRLAETKQLTEKGRKALTELLAQVRHLSAGSFAAGPFTPDHAETPAGPQPWKYALETSLVFPGAPVTTSTLYFTERLGGTIMYAGTADFGGVVFTVPQALLDPIFALTYAEKHDPGPPAPPKTEAAAPAKETPAAPTKE